MHTCIYMHACMHGRTCVRMQVGRYVGMHVCMNVCTHVCRERERDAHTKSNKCKSTLVNTVSRLAVSVYCTYTYVCTVYVSRSLSIHIHTYTDIFMCTPSHTHTVTYLLDSSMSRLFVVGPQPLAEVLKNLSRTVPGTALAGPQSCSCHSGHLEAVPAPGLSVCLSSSRFPPVRFLCLLLCLRSKNLTLKPRCF